MSMTSSCAVGNAPVSYGAFELTVGVSPYVPDGSGVLNRVEAAGYRGIDLGPVGYLGVGADLAASLDKHGLGLTGGYLELPFHDPEAMPAALAELDELLDVLDAARAVNEGLGLPAPLPTIAVTGRSGRRANPGRAATDRSWGYTEEEWDTFAGEAERGAAVCRARGYRPVFHNETGSNVEADWELARVAELTSFDLCLDTGHLIAGGGDPVTFLREHGGRIGHLHVKSAHKDRMRSLVERGDDIDALWSHRVFCRLGEGALDVAALMRAVDDIGYEGWIVVEQDIFPDEASLAVADDDQRHNREVLRAFGC